MIFQVISSQIFEVQMERTEMVYIERTSSIENEPRTLNLDQIHFAREAALYVINTMGIEEAMRIFTQGLEPVENCGRDDKEATPRDKNEEVLPSSNHDMINLEGGVRDIASAPF
ncbi:hypothetical protein Leryth_002001 [Lithospermum erythrorhizon]|nr:hypothetical protein Leryth_002001 [Lithospermum erythrorhizon]